MEEMTKTRDIVGQCSWPQSSELNPGYSGSEAEVLEIIKT
jgi:hypothetical protein